MVFRSTRSMVVNNGSNPEWLTQQRSPCVLFQHSHAFQAAVQGLLGNWET